MTYNEFIQNIINTRGQWAIEIKNSYCERHHIIPRCLGGEPKRLTWQPHKNVIWLTPKEHFIAHTLLARENLDNDHLVLAWSMMAFPKGDTARKFAISPDEYQDLRIRLSEICKNRVWSTEMRQKMSDAAKLREASLSDEVKLQRQQSMRQTWQTKYTKEERSYMASYRNLYMSPESKLKRKTTYREHWFTKSPDSLLEHAKKSARPLDKNGAWNKHWYNNGIYYVYVEKCPVGYSIGKGINTIAKPAEIELVFDDTVTDILGWTEQQIQFLVLNRGILSTRQIAQQLNKPYNNVKIEIAKLKKLGVIPNENIKRRKTKN